MKFYFRDEKSFKNDKNNDNQFGSHVPVYGNYPLTTYQIRPIWLPEVAARILANPQRHAV